VEVLELVLQVSLEHIVVVEVVVDRPLETVLEFLFPETPVAVAVAVDMLGKSYPA
jgi:hypothetical protein